MLRIMIISEQAPTSYTTTRCLAQSSRYTYLINFVCLFITLANRRNKKGSNCSPVLNDRNPTVEFSLSPHKNLVATAATVLPILLLLIFTPLLGKGYNLDLSPQISIHLKIKTKKSFSVCEHTRNLTASPTKG